MSIPVQCPACAFQARVKSKYAGKRLRCPQCRSRIYVPVSSDNQELPDEEVGVDLAGTSRLGQKEQRVWEPPPPPPVSEPLPPPSAVVLPPSAVVLPPLAVQKGRPAWLLISAGSLGALLLVAAFCVVYLLVNHFTSVAPNSPEPRVALVDAARVRSSAQEFQDEPQRQDAKRSGASAAQPADVLEIMPREPSASAGERAPSGVPAADSGADEEPPRNGLVPEREEQAIPSTPRDGVVVEEANAASNEPNAATEERAAPAVSATVTFKPLQVTCPATSMAMTEDGRYLVISHQADNQLTIYDVLDRKTVVSIATVAPRCVLCRDNRVFVSQDGQGTISILKAGGDWKSVGQLRVSHPHIVHLSAPGGHDFRGELLVTCHGPGLEASYQDSHVFLVDVRTDKCQPVSHAPVASTSYDGRIIMTQDSFRRSPAGAMAAFRFPDYLSTQGNLQPLFRGGAANTPFVYQVCASDLWIANQAIFGGDPITPLEKELGKLIVPDISHKVIYSLTEESVTAHRLNPELTDMGTREVIYPLPRKNLYKMYYHLYRMRDYLLDHPVACTHGDRLFLFILTAEGGSILAAETAAFFLSGET